jgi:hypothetical protein
MPVPSDHHAEWAIDPPPVSRPTIAMSKLIWLRDQWPVVTVAFGALLTLVWIGVLIWLFLLLAIHHLLPKG